MRRILLENVTEGMKLARALTNADGITLLNAGTELKERYLNRLKELDVTYVYIEDDITADIEIPDVVSEKVRFEAICAAKNIMLKSKVNGTVDVGHAKRVTNGLIDELCRNYGILMNFIDMRTKNDYLFGHSVNVCILSIMTGISLGYNELQLRDLGVGALLHDVGKTQIPDEILNKAGRLTQCEMEEVKRHPELGFEILRRHPDLNLVSAHCAYQHHERYDGSGYPRRMQGKNIHQFAQIVAVADVFDSLTADVAQRTALPVCEAVAIIEKAGGTYFDPRIVKCFCDNVATYPIGTVVLLNTKEIGVVVDVSKENKARPVVRIIIDKNKRPINRFIEIDLSKTPQVYIADVVER